MYGHSGRLGGAYRKRHLGEGEEGYRTGEGPGVFQLGAARFGVALCAEGGVDFPWNEAVAGGAAVVFFCSAPGLDGRRTDERGWREGHAWWVSSGLGDAARHARRLAVPVAMATQAGSTEDEDFPGLAALVSPAGEVARLPDWRPGSLVVEVAADVTVQPVREAVRCLVVDHAGRALLFRYADARADGTWWGPPGGGLAPGEDHLAAVRRELLEELARDDLQPRPLDRPALRHLLAGAVDDPAGAVAAVPRRALRRRPRPSGLAVGRGHPGAALVVRGGAPVRHRSWPPPATCPTCWTGSPAVTSPTPTRTSGPSRRAAPGTPAATPPRPGAGRRRRCGARAAGRSRA